MSSRYIFIYIDIDIYIDGEIEMTSMEPYQVCYWPLKYTIFKDVFIDFFF